MGDPTDDRMAAARELALRVARERAADPYSYADMERDARYREGLRRAGFRYIHVPRARDAAEAPAAATDRPYDDG